MRSEYLIFNLIVISGPLLGTLLYQPTKWPNWKAAVRAITVMAGIFLVWDHLVTGTWWFFNPLFTLGIKIGKLPIEEVLFFMTVPWSCLFIWHNLRAKLVGCWTRPIHLWIAVIGAAIAGWGLSQQLWYTAVVGLCLVIVGVADKVGDQWFKQRASTVFLGIVICLTLVFNGYLTARPVVIYEASYITGIRLFTIPIEDMLYGLVLISGTVMIYERLAGSATRVKQDDKK